MKNALRKIPIQWNPSDRQLRQFGLAALVAMPILGWVWTAGAATAVLWSAAAGLAVAALGLLRPRGLRPLFIGLSLAAFPIGMLVNELCLGLLFFCVFLPAGLLFRLMGRDSLERRFDPKAASYWQPKKQPTDAAGYFRRW
jgi:hypothetical protein